MEAKINLISCEKSGSIDSRIVLARQSMCA